MSSAYMLGKNPYQGTAPKVLFVCTGGILRSATCAHYAHKTLGWNTRSCGIRDDAIPPVCRNLLEWADRIFCLESEHAVHINQSFDDAYAGKISVLSIDDRYSYNDPYLLAILAEKLQVQS